MPNIEKIIKSYKDLIEKQKYQIKMLQKDLYRMYLRIKNNE